MQPQCGIRLDDAGEAVCAMHACQPTFWLDRRRNRLVTSSFKRHCYITLHSSASNDDSLEYESPAGPKMFKALQLSHLLFSKMKSILPPLLLSTLGVS